MITDDGIGRPKTKGALYKPLVERMEKLNQKLSNLEKQPNLNAEKKGQISENLRISDNEKESNE